MARIYVTFSDSVEKDENNLVNVRFSDGSELLHLECRRMFPISAPKKYITLLDFDGVEQCVIQDLSLLSDASRQAVEASLTDYYLVPIISRILRKEDRYGVLRWYVETDRGERSFDIRNRNRDIRVLPDARIRVRDSTTTVTSFNPLNLSTLTAARF